MIGLNKDTAMSFSAGYAWQGAFIREAMDLPPASPPTGGGFGAGAFDLKRKIDPGDVFTGNANITTQIGKLVLLGLLRLHVRRARSRSTASKAGGRARATSAILTATYPIDDRWALALNGSWSFQEKNEI